MDRYDHKHMEAEWQGYWDKNGTYKYDRKSRKPVFSIDTPPPYPTGRLHMGHVLNWCYMDFLSRYRRMNGFEVFFPQGWDCHGLPTEVKVEETNKINKNDVPREKFRQMCIELTEANIIKMRSQMKAMGFSQDWALEYVTMRREYYSKTQLSFLELYHKDLIYQAEHPVNWCPRCETAIAYAEVEYKERSTFLNFVRFKTEAGEPVIIATTRPELLSACVGVAVHPQDEKNKSLVGKKLKVPIYDRFVPVIADDAVDPSFGTGIVMICTFGDKTDANWQKKHNLPIIKAVDEKGLLTSVTGKYAGMKLEDARKAIALDLEKDGHTEKKERLKQNYGACWRCKSPIEILSNEQWFVAVRKLKEQIIQAANSMEWVPDHMKTRLINWAEEMDWDWVISRQRIFATPVPVWYCTKCGKIMLPDKAELPVDPTKDQPKNPCTCGSTEFTGETDVLDTWMDSSITPLVNAGWPKIDEKLFPASVRPQGHDIIRTWAFYTTLRSLALAGKPPFKMVLINGMVRGEDGRKMSKSLGNVVEPDEALAKFGADAIRQWAAQSVPGSDLPFAWKDVEHGSKFVKKTFNAAKFAQMHLAGYEPHESPALEPTDKWVLSKLSKLVEKATSAMDSFEFVNAIVPIQQFLWHDFCDNYVEETKYRLYGTDAESKKAAQYTIHKIFEASLRLLAPFTPHIAEEAYQTLIKKTSVHQEKWPSPQDYARYEPEEKAGDKFQLAIAHLRKHKSQKALSLNSELAKVTVHDPSGGIKLFEAALRSTMNIKELVFAEAPEGLEDAGGIFVRAE